MIHHRIYQFYNVSQLFFPDTLVDQIAENTNLYTVWRSSKSADTNEIKIKVFIGMHMLMSIDNKIAIIF